MNDTLKEIGLIGLVFLIGHFVASFVNNDVKSCDFVCSHLYKEVVLDDHYFKEEFYPDISMNIGNIEFKESIRGGGRATYPHNVINLTPVMCLCTFRVKELENSTENYDVYNLKEVVYAINYTKWKNWWDGRK